LRRFLADYCGSGCGFILEKGKNMHILKLLMKLDRKLLLENDKIKDI
jgi:hypothetical protein